MGLQITCPLCGMSSTPRPYGSYNLTAKEVTSKGGDRGFDHSQVPLPQHHHQSVVEGIDRIHRRYVRDVQTQVERSVDRAVEKPDLGIDDLTEEEKDLLGI